MIYIAAAIVMGVVIGAERELRRKPAGFKTHTFVCASCCLLTLAMGELYSGQDPNAPARIIGHILAGIGFIGAGVIFKSSEYLTPVGITTAAEIWCAAVVGILCGIHKLEYAGIMTAVILLSQILFKPLERKLWRKDDKETL
jgi:putative Mg2+ transporter-C (MgtC) family protein